VPACWRSGSDGRGLLAGVVRIRLDQAIPQSLPRRLADARDGPLVSNPIAGTGNHQHGSMRMGFDANESVVNELGRFHGIPNLYIGDASVCRRPAAITRR